MDIESARSYTEEELVADLLRKDAQERAKWPVGDCLMIMVGVTALSALALWQALTPLTNRFMEKAQDESISDILAPLNKEGGAPLVDYDACSAPVIASAATATPATSRP